MGKKNRAPKQNNVSAETVSSPVPVAEEVIHTPVKPTADTFQEVTPVVAAEEKTAVIATPEKSVAAVAAIVADENKSEETTDEAEAVSTPEQEELSPGGESPQGKKQPVRQEEVEETTPAVVELNAEEVKEDPSTAPATARQQCETSAQYLESPTSPVDPEPLLPSATGSTDGVCDENVVSPPPGPLTTSKVVAAFADFYEQPAVQFVVALGQRVAVALLVLAIQLYQYLLTTSIYSKALTYVEEAVKKHFKTTVAKELERLQGYWATAQALLDAKVLTPVQLWDTETPQGQAVAAVVAGVKEVIDEATAKVQKEKEQNQ